MKSVLCQGKPRLGKILPKDMTAVKFYPERQVEVKFCPKGAAAVKFRRKRRGVDRRELGAYRSPGL
ncbi:hypothetical protein [uncultured Campylobacter sp.]|uniref:hypothetical protein n=1 Tax=uncultured Campylobacter sp. TaxID=218934 RepID=UPI00261419B3|nr:hypothetical protein [uncultured Campylobacter sp.]